jgi:hypothetical protein
MLNFSLILKFRVKEKETTPFQLKTLNPGIIPRPKGDNHYPNQILQELSKLNLKLRAQQKSNIAKF